jgi:D-alanine-D-alanine ligase
MLVCVLYTPAPQDAPPEEFDGLVQRDAVAQALEKLGHRVEKVPFLSDLDQNLSRLRQLAPDCVFNLVEAVAGEDYLQAAAPMLLESLGLPYTGCSFQAMALCADKLSTKRRLKMARLPTAPWADCEQPITRDLIGRTLIWKHRTTHASVGLDEDSLAEYHTARALEEELRKRGAAWYAEEFIDGREFNISLLQDGAGARMLPPAEIDFSHFPPGKPRLVGYRAKWVADSFEYHHTERIFDFPAEDEQLIMRLEEICLSCWQVFSLRGYARVDFRIDREERPWVLEINTNPCISPDAGFAAAALRAGLDYLQLIEAILRAALPG